MIMVVIIMDFSGAVSNETKLFYKAKKAVRNINGGGGGSKQVSWCFMPSQPYWL